MSVIKNEVNLKINFYGLLYNHDDYSIQTTDLGGIFEKTESDKKKREKNDIKYDKVNQLNIKVMKNDNIDYIKKRIVIELLDKLGYDIISSDTRQESLEVLSAVRKN